LQLVEVINEDYNDFVSLSTKLVNVDGAVLRMQRPLQVTPPPLPPCRSQNFAFEENKVKICVKSLSPPSLHSST